MLATIIYLITGKWFGPIVNDETMGINRGLIHDGFTALEVKDRG